MFNFFNKTKEPIKLWFSTDIHAHVLAGVDDGSPDLDKSVQLVGELGELGITKILASPHIARDTFENSQEKLDKALVDLREAVNSAGLGNIALDRHSENRIDDLFSENIEAGNLKVLPDNYILIENSFVQEPWNLENIIYDLNMRGYRPILAHPERYVYYHVKPSRYADIHKNCQFQVNVLSMAGYYGKHVKKMAERLVEADMVDFMGTDTHGLRHTACFREYLAGKDALKHARALEGKIQNRKFD